MHTNLIHVLKKQIEFCNQFERYKCGIFVRTKEQQIIVEKCIKNLTSNYGWAKHNRWESIACWDNGSYIKILPVNDNIRGNRFNGAIIENEIDRDIVNSLIMPYLAVVYDIGDKRIEDFGGSVKDRIFVVEINDDIIESKNHSIYITTGWQRNNVAMSEGLRNSSIFIDDLCEEIFKKECMRMFNNHTAAYRVAQVRTNKIYVYNATGIPRENIKYETEFVNRNKETYLNINGEYKNEDIGFENEINVHLLIDTGIYDKYEVEFHDGLVLVVLHEIINEKPVLEDVTGNN